MNAFTLNLTLFCQRSTRLHRDVAQMLVGISILALVCQSGMAQEPIPLSNIYQRQVVEAEEISQACRIPADPAGLELTVDIQPRGKDSQIVPEENLPEDCAQYVFSDVRMFNDELEMTFGRNSSGYNWAAARFCHQPLYFQEYALERCGVHHGFYQPVISGIHFFGNAVLLPWRMCQSCPHGCECTPVCDCTY